MRKIILSLGISLNGYIARKNGAVDWLSMDWDYDWMAFFKTIDAVLMGRKSWEKAQEMMPKSKSGAKKKTAAAAAVNPYAGIETYVFSNTLKETDVAAGVEIVSGNLTKFVEKLKSKNGKDIWLSGGSELAKSFLNENLVDEIQLGVTPILLGSGIPLFPELAKEHHLRLISSQTHKHKKEDNAMLTLIYEVKK